MISQKNKQGWRNPWVFGLAIIVLAGVLVNGRMYLNVLEHPTRVLDDEYTVRDHNRSDAIWVQQQTARSTLGWQASLHTANMLQNDPLALPAYQRYFVTVSPSQYRLELRDHDGKALQGAKINIVAQWPSDPKLDFTSEFYEAGTGLYEGTLDFSRAGNWDLVITATQEGSHFEMEQKVFVLISKK